MANKSKVADFLGSLNKEQLEAVKSNPRSAVIVAGPGTGKTATLAAKIVYLIKNEGYQADEILALTFTKKAAQEMQQRVSHYLDTHEIQKVLTFHALGHSFLQALGIRLNLLADREKFFIIREFLQDRGLKNQLHSYTIKDLLQLISNYKNYKEQKIIEELDEKVRIGNFPEGLVQLVRVYQHYLQQRNLVDYDDLLIKTLDILKKDRKIFNNLFPRLRYILVDEFQDTSDLQLELLRIISGGITAEVKEAKNRKVKIFAIGDPLQAIYSFRSGTNQIFKKFQEIFPRTQVYNLQKNYRSAQKILQTAHRLFPESPLLMPVIADTGRITLVTTLNPYSEADWIVGTISSIIGGTDIEQSGNILAGQLKRNEDNPDEKIKLSDFAVLYRIHHLGGIVKSRLRESGIPFQAVDEVSFYQEPETVFVINVLRFIARENDEFFRGLQYAPMLKLSTELLVELNKYTHNSASLWAGLREFVKRNSLQNQLNKLYFQNFLKLFNLLQELIQKKSQDLKSIVDNIASVFDLQLNPEFLNALLIFLKSESPLQAFLNFYEKLEQHDFFDTSGDKIALLTMHAAKGLEFKYVFLVGFEEGIIPYEKSFANDEQIEEEQRLLYVAITRAKAQVFLIKTRERNRKKVVSSRFEKLLEHELQLLLDPAISKIEKRRKLNKEKKSQIKFI